MASHLPPPPPPLPPAATVAHPAALPICPCLPQKYRILFSLRGIAGPAAHAAMLEGLKDPSALFRHEVRQRRRRGGC